jgi:hypothetical protein
MKRLIGAVVVLGSLVGCATPQQNAALTGAIIGAAVMGSVYSQPAPRPLQCHSTKRVIGYDIYHRPVYQHRQVCR